MEYSVKVTGNGYVESLTVNGKEYKKRWVKVGSGHYKCQDDEFYEQLELDGYNNDEFLDKICDDIYDAYQILTDMF